MLLTCHAKHHLEVFCECNPPSGCLAIDISGIINWQLREKKGVRKVTIKSHELSSSTGFVGDEVNRVIDQVT